ncbi:MAG: substrate-binding domain-containing protein [Chitinophagaceae bacterium]
MKPFLFTVISAIIFFLPSCVEDKIPDNQTSGHIKISVDESYKPIMEEQLKIFLAQNPNAIIDVEYKPEAECFNDFLEDSTRVIFVTRELNQEEKKYCESKQIVPKSLAMARDAVCFITSTANNDLKLSIPELKNILKGTDQRFQIVFDNQASSSARYIKDSLIPNESLSSNVFAAKTSEEVIQYVSENKKSIGVIGVNWVSDHSDTATQTFLEKVHIIPIKPDADSATKYVKPYQAYIGLKTYPLTRNFYFISKETWQGLGTGLVNYLCRNGQLVFKQSKLFPLRVNVFLREASANQ